VSGTASPIRGRGAAVAGSAAVAAADAGVVEDAGAVEDADAEGSSGAGAAFVTDAPSIPRKQLMSAALEAGSMGLCLFIG
jgi:hypothetical protein